MVQPGQSFARAQAVRCPWTEDWVQDLTHQKHYRVMLDPSSFTVCRMITSKTKPDDGAGVDQQRAREQGIRKEERESDQHVHPCDLQGSMRRARFCQHRVARRSEEVCREPAVNLGLIVIRHQQDVLWGARFTTEGTSAADLQVRAEYVKGSVTCTRFPLFTLSLLLAGIGTPVKSAAAAKRSRR